MTLAGSQRTRVVDMHCHFGVPAADDLVRQAAGDVPTFDGALPPLTAAVNKAMFAAIGCKLNGTAERIEDMDRLGIDMQIMSPSPGSYHYGAEAEVGAAAARVTNDAVAAAVARHPDRLTAMGTVPLQQVDLAIAELRRCRREHGMVGIEIGTNVGGRDLHEPEFEPFFAAAEELDMPLFLHPLGFTEAARLRAFYFNNLIGNPLETTLALGHLIFGGVLDMHPRLKIIAAHGGGYLPAYWGRMDHAWRVRADCRTCRAEPSSYLRRLWFDTLVFDPAELDHLVTTVGFDRLCLGSDYPFDMAEADPVGFLARTDEAGRARMLGLNAVELFGLGHA